MTNGHISVYRASRELMDEVRACINSNSDLYKDIVDPSDWSEHSPDDAWAERNFKIREFYLGRADGQYIGAGSYQNFTKFAYIGYFYIKRAYHGKGYGRGLMQFLEMRTIMDNIPILRLFCNPRSTWAVNFYKKMGFFIRSADKAEILALDNGVFGPFYEQDSYLMEKALPPPKPMQ